MLEIVRYNEEEYTFPCLLVLGCFDGLHVGHAELLKKAKLQAKINGLDLGIMLFTDGKGGKQLYSFEERVKFLENFNVKFVLKIDFDDEFKKIKPLDFLACLEDKLNIKAYMSGKDFRFGQGKKGKASTLKSYAEDEENGVWYMPVKDVVLGDEKVSTTRIKTCLENGDIIAANQLLGRNYSVSGTVIRGADRGGKLLGYPTMNIAYPDYKFEVKAGVYKVKCTVGETEYYGIANYGARPTFGENNALLEVHLQGLEGLHYDETVTVEFINYLRDICKFDSAEALIEQLSKDILCLDAQAELAVANGAESQPESQVETQPEPAEQPAAVVPEETSAEVHETQTETADAEVEQVHEIQTETAEEQTVTEPEAPQEETDEGFEEELEETVEEIPEEANEEIVEETREEPAASDDIPAEIQEEPLDGITQTFDEVECEFVEPETEETASEEAEEPAQEEISTETETCEPDSSVTAEAIPTVSAEIGGYDGEEQFDLEAVSNGAQDDGEENSND